MSNASGTPTKAPRRGEVWFANLNPTLGHEQAGYRPIVIVSSNAYNARRTALVMAVPLTSKIRPLPDRVSIAPPEGGLKVASDILCGHLRALSHDRLVRHWGAVAPSTLAGVENTLRNLLGL